METGNGPTKKRHRGGIFWVGLGASAGGLEALRGLVRNLPINLPATYFVVQHMGPQHKSMLADIIGRETEMPVLDVTDNLVPKRDTIYITPPNYDIVVEKNRVRLIEPSQKIASPKPSVTRFFETLAEHKKSKAVAIVLSGTGSDGSKGISAVRARGGITIAQDELTAKYSSMPSSAMETGAIDLVMSPEEIGSRFDKIVATPRNLDALKASHLNFDSISELIRLLNQHTKVNFRHYKTATFQRRVERRIVATKSSDLETYVELARSSNEEVEALFRDMLISVTSFFRDPIEFESLANHLQKIVDDKNGEPIRVWIPGAATGEEAYSIAILFSEAIRNATSAQHTALQIFATDIDLQAIDVARRGFYPESAMDQVPGEFIDKYFDKVAAGYSVKKALREKIVFSVHNVAQDAPFLNIDMISCRNLLIYFQTSLQADVFNRFHYSLVPYGLLFLGKSEAATASEDLFRLLPNEKHIFHHKPLPVSRAGGGLTYDLPDVIQPRKSAYPSLESRQLEEANARFETLVESLGPNGFLVGENMLVKRAFGDVTRYVGLCAGSVDTKVRSLLREPYRQDILASAPGVIRKNAVHIGISRAAPDNPRLQKRMSIYPIRESVDHEPCALVVFKQVSEEPAAIENYKKGDSPKALRDQIDLLTNELAIAKNNLQQTVEELETSNEELQALNEELQSSNEELQSTNEELETANEELQSTNQELTTVNEELQVNTHQLSLLNQSLSNIFDNISLPMLVVDHDLHITHASKVSESYFGIPSNLSLLHISRCNMRSGYPNLAKLINSSMDSGAPVTVQIDDRDENAVLKVVPHFDDAGHMIGTIVIVSDNTEQLRTTLEELARSNEELNRFSYICSHDMKEPVRMIEAMTSLLIDPNFKADRVKRMDVLKRINTNTHRLGAIIDSLLAYSRIDAKVEYVDVDLNRVLSDIIEGLSLAIGEQGADLEIDNLPTIQGARVHFTQLFQNLVGNALKFCDKQNAKIRIASQKKNNAWTFIVEDNGPGIPEESRREIFNLFSRLQRRDEVEGTGLGLSIVQRIATQYGGTVECVESDLGGAAFAVTLPVSVNDTSHRD